MESKLCIVTGATDGIGRVTAQALAERGAEVVLVGRNAAKGAEVGKAIRRSSCNDRVRFEQADLSSQTEIRALADRLTAGGAAIDVLVNNVGALFMRRRESADGIEMTFALNHLGYFLLTGLLLERLHANGGGRIVNVASEAHRGAQMDLEDPQGTRRYRGWRAYQRSKLANVLFTYRLAALLAGTPVTANCLHPGFVASRFGHNNGCPFVAALKVMMRLSAIDMEAGARTSVHLATSADVAGVSGRYFDECREAASSLASHDEDAGRRLWEMSETLTGHRY
ncbi:MAG: SDR family oxidoreductase [Rhodospirillaceae bacterium]|nr:SDR family oxidoreductase [Rhodospirillaceae bacterium]